MPSAGNASPVAEANPATASVSSTAANAAAAAADAPSPPTTSRSDPSVPLLRNVAGTAVLSRLIGSLDLLIDRGVARRERGNLIALSLRPEEAEQGGTAAISMPV